jgi:two-component system sensor histidine kinase AlgZ
LAQNTVEYRYVTMASIRQSAYPDLLPDFRNLGVIARVLLAVNALALAGALFAAPDLAGALELFVHTAAYLEPLLLVQLVALAALSPLLARLRYWTGSALIVAVVLALVAAYHALAMQMPTQPPPSLPRALGLAALVAAALLGYLRLLAKAHSPALVEARLQALQARIRPHFLFNSLNAVLALIRRDPKRAERSKTCRISFAR